MERYGQEMETEAVEHDEAYQTAASGERAEDRASADALALMDTITDAYIKLEGNPHFEKWRKQQFEEMLEQHPDMKERMAQSRTAFLAYVNAETQHQDERIIEAERL